MLRLRIWRLSTSSFILHVYMRLLNFIWSMKGLGFSDYTDSGAPSIDLWFLFGISSAYRLLIITTPWWELLFLGVLYFSILLFWVPVLGDSLLLYLVVLKFTACVGISFWSLRLLGERPIVFHFPRFQFRDVAQGSDRMIILCTSSGALISSQAIISGPSFVSETGLLSL